MRNFLYIILFYYGTIAMAGNAIDSRFYYCKGENILLSIFQVFGEGQENFVSVEIGDARYDLDKVRMKNGHQHLKVSAKNEKNTKSVSFRLEKPRKSENTIIKNGVTDYQQPFETKLRVKHGNRSRTMNMRCKVFRIQEEFYNHIVSIVS